jgi:hypothetical protein
VATDETCIQHASADEARVNQAKRTITENTHTAMPTPPTRHTATAHKRQRVFIGRT